jgi:4-amino-4-deoxy-L-arabinose transferase-like glycosyltransferase
MIYQNQAVSARVDMTLCFFVTLSLVLFYALYRGLLTHPVWYFAFYTLVGLGTLAKGPLGILLPGLVIGVFLALKTRWDLIAKFALHPGVLVTLLLVVGWYGLAITRGGEGFVDRQLLSENVSRFFGGSGHSHPVYYYLSYLFSLGLPWSLFFPFMLWDSFRRGATGGDDRLFLKAWFAVLFLFFSLSAGKRPVYLLPLFPALALLMALWIHDRAASADGRMVPYRIVATFAGVTGVVLLVITTGGLWNHELDWLFSPIASVLKPKDRANLTLVQNAVDNFSAIFTVVSFVTAALWLALGRSLWRGQLRTAAWIIVLNAIPFMFIGRGLLLPVIAEEKSYRDFMGEVNQMVKSGDKLFIYGDFNSDPVVFYRGESIDVDARPIEAVAAKPAGENSFVIMTDEAWKKMQALNSGLPKPLARSSGKGPEGDAPLVLLRAEIS